MTRPLTERGEGQHVGSNPTFGSYHLHDAKEYAVAKSRSSLKNVLAGMTVRERLLFLIRYARAHAAKRREKQKGK